MGVVVGGGSSDGDVVASCLESFLEFWWGGANSGDDWLDRRVNIEEEG